MSKVIIRKCQNPQCRHEWAARKKKFPKKCPRCQRAMKETA